MDIIRQISLDLGARLGLLGPSVLHADKRLDLWETVLIPQNMRTSEDRCRRLLSSWMKRNNTNLPIRFVGFPMKNGYRKRPSFSDLTVYGFEVGIYEDINPEKPSLYMVWSSPMFDFGAKQKMYFCPADPRVPVL